MVQFQKGNQYWKLSSKNKGKKHSIETIKKMSESHKGKNNYWFGKHLPEEVRKKISKTMKEKVGVGMRGDKNPTKRPEIRKKISEAIKERYSLNEELKRKLRERMKEQMKGNKLRLGKKFSQESILKMKLAKIGNKNSNWKGGKSFGPYPTDWRDDLKESIRKRDGYVCQLCGIHQDELKGFHKKLDIHHIDYNKDNLNPDNLITLCRTCHIKTNFNREYWIKYFYNHS